MGTGTRSACASRSGRRARRRVIRPRSRSLGRVASFRKGSRTDSTPASPELFAEDDLETAGNTETEYASEDKVDLRPSESLDRRGWPGGKCAARKGLLQLGWRRRSSEAGILHARFAHPIRRWIREQSTAISGLGPAVVASSQTPKRAWPTTSTSRAGSNGTRELPDGLDRALDELPYAGNRSRSERRPGLCGSGWTPTRCSSSTGAGRTMTLATKPWRQPEKL